MYDIDKHSNISWQAVFRYISLTPTHQTLENQMHGKWIDVHILRWNENEKPMQKGQGERNIHEKSSICELPYHFVIFCDILDFSKNIRNQNPKIQNNRMRSTLHLMCWKKLAMPVLQMWQMWQRSIESHTHHLTPFSPTLAARTCKLLTGGW